MEVVEVHCWGRVVNCRVSLLQGEEVDEDDTYQILSTLKRITAFHKYVTRPPLYVPTTLQLSSSTPSGHPAGDSLMYLKGSGRTVYNGGTAVYRSTLFGRRKKRPKIPPHLWVVF